METSLHYTHKIAPFILIIALLMPISSKTIGPFSHKKKKKAATYMLNTTLSLSHLLELCKEQRESELHEEQYEKTEEEMSWLEIGMRSALFVATGYFLYTNRLEIAIAFLGASVFLNQDILIGPYICKGIQATLPCANPETDIQIEVIQLLVAQQAGSTCGGHAAKNILKFLECFKNSGYDLHTALNAYEEIEGQNLYEHEVAERLDAGVRRIFPEIPYGPANGERLPRLLDSGRLVIGSESPNVIVHILAENANPIVRAALYNQSFPIPIDFIEHANLAHPAACLRAYLINTNELQVEHSPPPAHWIACIELDTQVDGRNKKHMIFMNSTNRKLIGGSDKTVKNLLELHGYVVGTALD